MKKMAGYTSLEEIDRITREFRESIIQPDGSLRARAEQMEYLNTIHFDVPNLDYDVLFEIPRFLVRTTIFSGSVFGNADQPHFLSWMAQICDCPYINVKFQDWHFFGVLVSSHLIQPPISRHNIALAFRYFDIFAACFAFPYLERCIRTKCNKYVKDDGLVVQNFNIPRYGKSDRRYVKDKHRISNISDELKLLDRYVATPEFRARLRRFMDELNEDSWMRIDDPYELVGNYRNKLLHGKEFWSTGGHVATYLICMILLSEITREDYNSKIGDLKEDIKWRQETGHARHTLWYNYKLE